MAEMQLNNKTTFTKSSGKKKGHSFTRKCSTLVKEQRARIYVLRRCATMLLCWYIQGDE
ncbi:hypothetical protein UlMin_010521 [Ulmus minor]